MASRREILKLALVSAAAAGPARGGATGGGGGAKSVLEPFNYSGVRLLDGMLRKQCLAARDLFLNIPNDNLLIGFRKRAGLPAPGTPLADWYGGYPNEAGDVFHAFGQYLAGMARLSKGLGDAAIGGKARTLLLEWGKTIEPDGYFFYSRKPNSSHYAYEKTMGGLVDLYEYGGCQEALPLMEKITDWAVANLDRSRKVPLHGVGSSANGQEWYTLAENLYRAYQLTDNPKYKQFGDVWRYTEYWDMFAGEGELNPYGRHAYSHVNTFSSAAMAYAVTGEPQYLKTIVNAFDWLERTQMFATGGYGPAELLMAPDGSLGKSLENVQATFETVCGSWACFKLGKYLIRFTGEAKYGDWIEKLLYNGIGAALQLKPDGANFYYSDYTLGGGRKGYHPQKWTCCSGTYPEAIADYHDLIYFKDPGALYVNLFVSSEVVWNHGSNEVTVQQETLYPESEITALTVRPGRPEQFDLKFRVPRWSRGITAEVNGRPVQLAAQPGTWAAIRRTWNAGDRVKIRIPMPLALAPIDQQHPSRVALTCGPVVLVRQDNWLLIPGKGEPSRWILPEGEGLRFRVDDRHWKRAPLVPFYKLGFGEPYRMYFMLQS
ncbi:MAG: beta-L-arabinofuranosidase domain-containing protein [Bryobacteraceae bacterium]